MTREALDAVYRATTYRVFVASDAAIDIRIGERSPRLDALLSKHGCNAWVFVTAWNPGSQPLQRAENEGRQSELLALLCERGLQWLAGSGVPPDAAWHAEDSVLVLGIDSDEGVAIGRRFGQVAIVAGTVGCPAELVYCDRW